MQGMAAERVVPPGATPILEVPLHCPYYPQHATVRNAPVYVHTVSSVDGPGLLVQPLRQSPGRVVPLLNPVSPLAGRGPPALNPD